jgi:hypothetical protein
MRDLSASLLEGVFALFDDGIGCGFVLEPDYGRLLLFNSENPRSNCERGSENGKESHFDRGIGDVEA